MAPDYLLIGHVVQDITPSGLVLGGTATYSAITAQRLGWRVGVVTRTGPDLNVAAHLPGIAVHAVPGSSTTTYENVYQGMARSQWIRAVGDPLSLEDVPAEWREARIVHLAPLAQEFEPALAAAFSHTFVGATPQGWLRQWDEGGRVRYKPMAQPDLLLRDVRALIFSPEDVANDRTAMMELVQAVPLAVVTRADEGAVVYTAEGTYSTPARPSRVVDPTGAGDVFAAAFFIRLAETGDPLEAAAFANVVASFSIEGQGATAIPAREQVEAWRRSHREV
ncbi:MAG TPA: PfkB family carbohydrate kinase [Ardenticatenaceae bacterium]|nr:PfkB family carbohydrate kinase [Ardenticatenaceae bacterium]